MINDDQVWFAGGVENMGAEFAAFASDLDFCELVADSLWSMLMGDIEYLLPSLMAQAGKEKKSITTKCLYSKYRESCILIKIRRKFGDFTVSMSVNCGGIRFVDCNFTIEVNERRETVFIKTYRSLVGKIYPPQRDGDIHSVILEIIVSLRRYILSIQMDR